MKRVLGKVVEEAVAVMFFATVATAVVYASFFLSQESSKRSELRESKKYQEIKQVIVDNLGEEWLEARSGDLVKFPNETFGVFHSFMYPHLLVWTQPSYLPDGFPVVSWTKEVNNRPVKFYIIENPGFTLIKKDSPDYLAKVEKFNQQI